MSKTQNTFDWKFYLRMYPDLLINGINNRQKALHHYNKSGKIEERLVNETQSELHPKIQSKLSISFSTIEEFDKATKISVVMTHINRKVQLLQTLNSFKKYVGMYNFEVIVADDGSDDDQLIIDIIDLYKDFFNIIVVSISRTEKNWINPVVAYNKAIKHATGEIIIIQNAEIVHCGDIFNGVFSNLSKDNYVVFSVYNSPSFNHNKRLTNDDHMSSSPNGFHTLDYKQFDFDHEFYISKYPLLKKYDYVSALKHWYSYGMKNNWVCNKSGIFIDSKVIYKWKGWLSHPEHNQRCFHFLSAITRDKLISIGGFNEEFAYGLNHDDDEFIWRVSKNVKEIRLVGPKNGYGIHQYHQPTLKPINYKVLNKKNNYILQNNYAKKIECNPTITIISIYNNSKYSIVTDYLKQIDSINCNIEIIFIFLKTKDNVQCNLWTDINKYSFARIVIVDFNEINPIITYNNIFKIALGRQIIVKTIESTNNWKEIIKWVQIMKEGEYFCSFRDDSKYFLALFKSKLELIGGFNNIMKNDIGHTINEILIELQYNLKLVRIFNQNIQNIYNCIVSDLFEEQNNLNKEIFTMRKKHHEENLFNYPKLLHLYWDGSSLSFLNFMTVLSFNYYNKFWKIIVYNPIKRTKQLSWTGNEQKVAYCGKSYLSELANIENVIFKTVDLDQLGFYNDASEVIKSDYFRYYILQKHGGVWSDFDIIYTSSIEHKLNSDKSTCIFHCRSLDCYYYPIGLLLCCPNNVFFSYIMKQCLFQYNKTDYQTIGASMWKKLFPHVNDIYKIHSDVKICNEDYYLPVAWNQIYVLLNKQTFILPSNNCGIHWFNGLANMKYYATDIEKRISTKNFKVQCYLDKFVEKYINANNFSCEHYSKTISMNIVHNKQITFIINYCGQTSKMLIFFERMKMIYNTKYDIIYHIICNNILLDDKLVKYLNNNDICCKIFSSIKAALDNVQTTLVFFQDVIVLHTSELIIDVCINEIKNYDSICINKCITTSICDDIFINQIKRSKLPDVICLNVSRILENFSFNMDYFNNKLDYIIIERDTLEFSFPPKIPKKIHFYWDDSNGCYLTMLSLKTFIFNNPEWQVFLWTPTLKHMGEIIWESQEFIPPHNINYNDHNYLDYKYLQTLGVNIRHVDYFELGLDKNINEILKSDIFRWKILHTEGGVWSDLDILFCDRIEKTDFELNICPFNDIDTVVSQYQRTIVDVKEPIDFYYIGFLMGAPGSKFYKKLFNKAIENINELSYQGVGGDLIKRQFGLFNNLVGEYNCANLNSSSVYYYWWADLKNLYINKSQNDIHSHLLYNNNIVGYHWFRGVQLSKIYTLFLNYQNKIQNFNFTGVLPQWVDYYSNIFNDRILITHHKKISIVMGYINRLEQLQVTLKSILMSKHTNYEVIIVNDGVEDLEFIKQKYSSMNIIIVNNSTKNYVNPCLSYNLGVKHATGELLIIQNPECCHVGDILTTTNVLVKDNDYLAFSTFYLDTYAKNQQLLNLLQFDKLEEKNVFWNCNKLKNILNFTHTHSKNVLPDSFKGWVSHHFYNRNYLHFCVAVSKNKFEEIGGFSKEYADGICFDDDDLVRKLICNGLNMSYFCISEYPESYPSLAEHACFAIHQHHERFSYDDANISIKWEKNKNIFIKSQIIHVYNYIKTTYLNKDLLCNCNLSLVNSNIYSFDSLNNMYTINVTSNGAYIKFCPYIKKHQIDYIFNGKSLKLTNNIVELLNNCDYELIVSTNCKHIYLDNKDMVNNSESWNINGISLNKFFYFGKIDINKIVFSLQNENNNKIIFKCECVLKQIGEIDNTIYTVL